MSGQNKILPIHSDEKHAILEIRRIVTEEEEPLSKVVRFLKEKVRYYDWVGIYVIEGKNLVLNSFVGKPTIHTCIPIGKGICSLAVTEMRTIIIDDVLTDPMYIPCDERTRSEIVVPILANGRFVAGIDIDSNTPSAFTDWDKNFLEKVADILSVLFVI